MYRAYFLKRPLDLLLCMGGIFLFLPLWLIISILIWLETEGEIFYIQERVGLNYQVFKTIKFCTLYRDENNNIRISRLGNFLRRTALDESLQLINILKADMSFVGPRPLVPQEIGDDFKIERRFKIRPGLTGLAQIAIPKNSSVDAKFKYDLLYIENQSLNLDLKIIFYSILFSLLGRWEDKERRIFSGFKLKEIIVFK
ncbi:MAG: sugar transferase [Candidatus Omnitrophica bacterium]|nr:sugar transferase [Candidatus Omnitrophota bacterium]